MYRKISDQTNLYGDPALFIGAKLNPNNRWVKLAGLIFWEEFEEKYRMNFKDANSGRPAKTVRMALGAHIVKAKYHLSDYETVELIRENPYLQFFLGMTEYSNRAPFGASTMTWFRKHLKPAVTGAEVTQIIARLPKKPI